jgi:GTP cyclohydrolase I
MYVNELFKNINNNNINELNSQMKLFKNVDGISDMVIMKDIDFTSICEHHWLPFKGLANIGYVPNENIIGLSKIPRVVKYFSKKPQLQERLTKEIGEYLVKTLNPKFLIVELTATHDCVGCRGIESNCLTNTVFATENFNPFFISEFYARVKGGVNSGS